MYLQMFNMFIYGYICAVVAYDASTYQLQHEKHYMLINVGDRSAVTTGSAKESQFILV